MFECSREQSRPRQLLRPKRVVNSSLNSNLNGQAQTNGSASPSVNAKRNTTTNLNGGNNNKQNNLQNNYIRDDVNVDNLDFTKKILHTSWHPKDNIIAIAATNNLYIFYNKENSALQNPPSSAHFISTNTILPAQLNSNNNINNITPSIISTSNLNSNTITTAITTNNNNINVTNTETTSSSNSISLHKANQIITNLEETQQQDCSLTMPTSSAVISTCSQLHLSNLTLVTSLNNNNQQTNQNLNSSFYTAPTSMTTTTNITAIPVLTTPASSIASNVSTKSNSMSL
jgi:hypothetical protein